MCHCQQCDAPGCKTLNCANDRARGEEYCDKCLREREAAAPTECAMCIDDRPCEWHRRRP